MSRSETLPAFARDYLDALDRRLADLSTEERAELTTPVEQRLADLAREDDSGGRESVEQHFGSPEQLAADLRAAAGYPPVRPGQPAASITTADWLRRQATRPPIAAVVRYLASLRPAWWAARGYLLVAGVLAALSQGGGYRLHTIGSYTQASDEGQTIHSTGLWLLIPLTAIVASVVLGHLTPRLPPPGRLLVVALDAVAVLTLLAYPTWWLAPAFAYYTGLVS